MSRERWRRLFFVVGLIALVAIAVGIAFAGSKARLAEGTEIGGLDVSRLTAAQAKTRLLDRAEAVERVPVTFVAGGRRYRLSASQLGVRADWGAAVRLATDEGDGFGPVRGFRRLHARLFGAEVTPPASVFRSALSYTLDRIASGVEEPAVEASVRRRGLHAQVVAGHPGTRLDRAAGAELLVRSLAGFERGVTVTLPVVTRAPEVRRADLAVARAMAQLAMSAPVVLDLGSTRWRLPRWQIAKFLTLPSGGATSVRLGGQASKQWLAGLARKVDRPARDATFAVRPGGIDLVPSAEGRALDVPATLVAIERAAFSKTQRLAALVVRTAEPARSTEAARAMGVNGVVGSYTTTYGGTSGRVHNVALVAELIDGALVEPGGTFSFNATTGERNAAKGFEEAPVIINGELQTGIGGGVCQVSTTVFNAAFEAGLPIGRRTNHALYISHYPVGRDATVDYPELDLTFSNDTANWLLVRTFVNAGSLTVNLYGTPQHRRVESETAPLTVTGKVPTERTPDPTLLKGKRAIDVVGSPPRETSVSRRVYAPDGTLLYENTWRSSYVAEPTLVRVGTKPRPKAVPKHTPPPRAGGAPVAPVAPDVPAEPVTAGGAEAPVRH